MKRWFVLDLDHKTSGFGMRAAGVYAVYLDGELSYVGSSFDIYRRLSSYNIRRSYGAATWITPWGEYLHVAIKVKYSPRAGQWLMDEYRLIRRLLPRMNSVGAKRRMVKKFNHLGVVVAVVQHVRQRPN